MSYRLVKLFPFFHLMTKQGHLGDLLTSLSAEDPWLSRSQNNSSPSLTPDISITAHRSYFPPELLILQLIPLIISQLRLEIHRFKHFMRTGCLKIIFTFTKWNLKDLKCTVDKKAEATGEVTNILKWYNDVYNSIFGAELKEQNKTEINAA